MQDPNGKAKAGLDLHTSRKPYVLWKQEVQLNGLYYTAEQWKNYLVYFSVASMHDLLDEAVLECCRHFVLAC